MVLKLILHLFEKDFPENRVNNWNERNGSIQSECKHCTTFLALIS